MAGITEHELSDRADAAVSLLMRKPFFSIELASRGTDQLQRFVNQSNNFRVIKANAPKVAEIRKQLQSLKPPTA